MNNLHERLPLESSASEFIEKVANLRSLIGEQQQDEAAWLEMLEGAFVSDQMISDGLARQQSRQLEIDSKKKQLTEEALTGNS